MSAMVWVGAVLMLAGVVWLVVCIVTVRRIQRGQLTEADRTRQMQRVIVWNYGALSLAGFGAIVLIVGGLLS